MAEKAKPASRSASSNRDFNFMGRLLNRMHLKLRPKLILVFLTVKVIPIVLLTVVALNQIASIGSVLRDIAVADSSKALNDSAVENIERMTTDMARSIAGFLYSRDDDIRMLARMTPSDETCEFFSRSKMGRITRHDEWVIAEDGMSWVEQAPHEHNGPSGESSNPENNDMDGFRYRPPEFFNYDAVPLYDEVVFLDLEGNELFKYVSPDSSKVNYPFNPVKTNVSVKANTYVKAEDYFAELEALEPGDIYVSDVIGAYVGTNYIGMYAPGVLKTKVPETHPNRTLLNDIGGMPEEAFITEARAQAYAGKENPNGKRFEGIIRWVTPVTDENGQKTGYASFALNHAHVMEFVDHVTPMNERYTELPSAFEGNYAFIWDYRCRNISHPRHHSIVGFDPETGKAQVPWLESSLFTAWQESGIPNWMDFVGESQWPAFDNQSRQKAPAPSLTRDGLVGLDGRFLNNAPQCTGWMDLTFSGGSGSFYILWSGLYKLTTAGAIPYYTGRYAPSPENQYSRRGFGFVTIGAGLDDFTGPANETELKLTEAINTNMVHSTLRLVSVSGAILSLIVFIAILLSSYITDNIKILIGGFARFRSGERQFRILSPIRDEFGTLANAFDEMADSIVDSVHDPLSIIDMNHKVIYMNAAALEVINRPLDDLIGQSYDLVSIYPHATEYCPLTALEENRESEAMFMEDTGQYLRGSAKYLMNQDGQKIGYIISSSDVTEIETARLRAEQASLAKTNFLSNMSHEMRTPMNAIIGMTAIGTMATDIERKDNALKKIKDASSHLLGVINDILDMSKIEANKFSLSATEFVFERMIQRVVDVINFRVDEKRQTLTIHIEPAIPRKLYGDEQRLAQVIANLLTNAIKFTPDEGSIHLDASLESEKNGVCKLLIKVKDTGIGINEEQLGRLFTAFEQAEASTSRKYGGTGLGLVISRSIVEMMDGAIWVESKLNQGSTFHFTVCMVRGKDDNKAILSPDLSFQNMRLLIADNDEDARSFFEATARQAGIPYDMARSGREALKLVTQNKRYDLCFIDWEMPDMNGIELARRIREKGDINHIVLILSAARLNDIQRSAQEVGIEKFLTKPLFMSSITNCINECFGKGAYEHAETSDITDIDLAGHTVLLAEDVEINREIVLALLEPTQLVIDCAENGEEAVRMFMADPEKYEMVFMDLQMPEMDGFTATRRIRESGVKNADRIPIVAMTANVFREDILKCFEAGMNNHIGKPLDLHQVTEMLKMYLLH